jgi:hypothetical protein
MPRAPPLTTTHPLRDQLASQSDATPFRKKCTACAHHGHERLRKGKTSPHVEKKRTLLQILKPLRVVRVATQHEAKPLVVTSRFLLLRPPSPKELFQRLGGFFRDADLPMECVASPLPKRFRRKSRIAEKVPDARGRKHRVQEEKRLDPVVHAFPPCL